MQQSLLRNGGEREHLGGDQQRRLLPERVRRVGSCVTGRHRHPTVATRQRHRRWGFPNYYVSFLTHTKCQPDCQLCLVRKESNPHA